MPNFKSQTSKLSTLSHQHQSVSYVTNDIIQELEDRLEEENLTFIEEIAKDLKLKNFILSD
jgi:hypothetical protein